MSLTKSHFTSQVKVAILKYIESLARQMDPTDFVNSSETRLAVSRIITWTTEPKSSDVRKVSQGDEVCAIIIVLLENKQKNAQKTTPKTRTIPCPNPPKNGHKNNENFRDFEKWILYTLLSKPNCQFSKDTLLKHVFIYVFFLVGTYPCDFTLTMQKEMTV